MQTLKLSSVSSLRNTLRRDLCMVLSHFLSQSNLSISAFKDSWRTCRTSSLHHGCPSHCDYDGFLQICFDVLQSMLFQPPPAPTCGVAVKAVGKKSSAVLREANPVSSSEWSYDKLWKLKGLSSRTAVWNIAVMYTLYTLHATQVVPSSVALRSENEGNAASLPYPVRVSPRSLTTLLLAAEQWLQLGEFGRHACAALVILHEAGSLLYASYTGPRSLWSVKRHVQEIRDGMRRAQQETKWLDAALKGAAAAGPLADALPCADFHLPVSLIQKRLSAAPNSFDDGQAMGTLGDEVGTVFGWEVQESLPAEGISSGEEHREGELQQSGSVTFRSGMETINGEVEQSIEAQAKAERTSTRKQMYSLRNRSHLYRKLLSGDDATVAVPVIAVKARDLHSDNTPVGSSARDRFVAAHARELQRRDHEEQALRDPNGVAAPNVSEPLHYAGEEGTTRAVISPPRVAEQTKRKVAAKKRSQQQGDPPDEESRVHNALTFLSSEIELDRRKKKKKKKRKKEEEEEEEERHHSKTLVDL